jgi:hypothetical protein
MEVKRMRSERGETRQLAHILIAVAVLGSLWGFSEVVLSGALAAAGFPYRAALLTGIGLGLMTLGVAAYDGIWMPMAGAIVAVMCKLLVVPLLQVPASCKANSCLAVLVEGLALSVTLAFVNRRMKEGLVARVSGGAGTALLAAAAFFPTGMRLAPCPYLLSFNEAGGLLTFVLREGVPWAVASMALVPVGYWLGERLREGVLSWDRKPLSYYVGAAGTVACCWASSAVAILLGW